MKPALFYRVGTLFGEQGLWYDQNGVFTGLIHAKFSYLKSSRLEMPFDENVVGYLSATHTLQELDEWFSDWCLSHLRAQGFAIMEYVATDYKHNGMHWLISQQSSILTRII